jgi:uncharacterized metal-binding protein YceD (DUF177 family)
MSGDPIQPLAWTVAVVDVPAAGLAWTKAATADERAAITTALELKDCLRLEVTARIEGLAGGRYRLKGNLRADVVQACVITLEAVNARLNEPLDVEFRPAESLAKDDAINLDDPVDLEPIEKHRMDVGRVVFEQLTAGLDPYPRAEGAAFSDLELKPGSGRNITLGETKPVSPFAVLATLKPKPN